MKKKTKRILGSLGLLIVAAVTAFAAFLPAPGTLATSVTDTITVRVISGDPVVNINWLESGNQEVANDGTGYSSKIKIGIDYSAVKEPVMEVEYTSLDNAVRKEEIFRREAEYSASTEILTFDLYDMTGLVGEIVGVSNEANESKISKLIDVSSTERVELANYAVSRSNTQASFRLAESGSQIPYGYGTYKFTLSGYGENGTPATSAPITFKYMPGKATLKEDANGHYSLDLEYDYDNGEGSTPKGVSKVVVNVYDDEKLVYGPIIEDGGEKTIDLPFKKGEHVEDYTIKVGFYGRDGKTIVAPDEIVVKGTEADTPGTGEDDVNVPGTGGSTGKPDTGRFLGKLNIAKVDYLVTGLVVFGIIAIAGIVFVMKGGKNKAKARRK